MARRFAVGEPPSVPAPLRYGENFPLFLRSQGDAASIACVADIAELEMAREKARHAAVAVPLSPRACSPLRAERLGDLRLALHPSVYLVPSRFPIVTIWEANNSDRANGMIERWGAEAALVARPFAAVNVRRLPPGGFAFIAALSQGWTIAAAIDAGAAAAPEFDVATNLALLIETAIVVAIRARVAD